MNLSMLKERNEERKLLIENTGRQQNEKWRLKDIRGKFKKRQKYWRMKQSEILEVKNVVLDKRKLCGLE